MSSKIIIISYSRLGINIMILSLRCEEVYTMKRKINWYRVFMLLSAMCYYAAYLLSSELHVGETVYFTYDNDWLIMAGLTFGAYLYSVVNG